MSPKGAANARSAGGRRERNIALERKTTSLFDRGTTLSPAMQKVIDEPMNELLLAGVIEPSGSPHSAPIVLVNKKTGECA